MASQGSFDLHKYPITCSVRTRLASRLKGCHCDPSGNGVAKHHLSTWQSRASRTRIMHVIRCVLRCRFFASEEAMTSYRRSERASELSMGARANYTTCFISKRL